MNELREKIINEIRGGQESTINSELYDTKVIELLYGQKTDAILDAVIAALPEVRDIAGDDDWTMGHSDGQHDYKKKALAILQAAKENK